MAEPDRLRWGIGVLAALLATLHVSPAHAASGLVSVDASAKLKAKGCGKYAGNAAVTLALAEGGTWRMSIEDDELTGTYQAGGKGGRTLTLSPDAGSLAVIQTGLRNLAANVCGAPVDAATVTPKTVRAKLNKKGTSASLLLKASLAGDGAPLKKGNYTLSGNGALGPLPTTTTSTVTTTTSSVPTTVPSTFTTTTVQPTTSTLATTTTTVQPTTSSTIATTTSVQPTFVSTLTTTTTVQPTTSSTLATTTTVQPTSSTIATTTTLTSTSTTTTLLPAPGYGDCVNEGPGACLPTENCISGTSSGLVIGLCTAECGSDDDCPPAGTGTATVFCDTAETHSCLLRCNGGETCPTGMTCIESTYCLYTAPCAPNCGACGDDGCGGSCGECDSGAVCSDGQCVADDSCVGRCGTFDPAASCQCDVFCGGEGDCCADRCDQGVCDQAPVCNCTPDCSERACGDDGCGGSCGECLDPGTVCGEGGQCLATNSCVGRCDTADVGATCQCDFACDQRGDCCADLCEAGVCDQAFICTCQPDCSERNCGSDGCFGSCGSCETPGDICSVAGQCVARNSCVGRCGGADASAFCQCDPDCLVFEDCCPDICNAGVCDALPQCMAPPA